MQNIKLDTILKVNALTPHKMEFKEIGNFTTLGESYQKIFSFPNGYGASVICSEYSYGHENEVELALLNSDGEIIQHKEITDNVVGWLDPSECNNLLLKIAGLS